MIAVYRKMMLKTRVRGWLATALDCKSTDRGPNPRLRSTRQSLSLFSLSCAKLCDYDGCATLKIPCPPMDKGRPEDRRHEPPPPPTHTHTNHHHHHHHQQQHAEGSASSGKKTRKKERKKWWGWGGRERENKTKKQNQHHNAYTLSMNAKMGSGFGPCVTV